MKLPLAIIRIALQPVRLFLYCWCLLLWTWPALAAPQGSAPAGPLIPEPQPVQIYIFRQRLWLAPPAPATPQANYRQLLPPALKRPPTDRMAALIAKYARQHGVDPRLVQLVIRQESGGNPTAVSPKGAMGLMQLLPATAAELGVQDPFDIEQNLSGGIRYLKQCLQRFDGDLTLALAAYNAGPNRVAARGGVPDIPETQAYVSKILNAYQRFPFLYPRNWLPK